MNLFILSLCVKKCAEYMFDKHVSKIILEAVQMLSTAKHLLDEQGVIDNNLTDKIYKIAHKNHPVTKWIRESQLNYIWTLDLVEAMHNEWKYRYGHPAEKQHKSYLVSLILKEHIPSTDKFEKKELTSFALAMPDTYKSLNAIQSYRKYYMSPDKQKIASWTKRDKPKWYYTIEELEMANDIKLKQNKNKSPKKLRRLIIVESVQTI